MYILRIEHPVPDYAGWKKAFDGDPALRKKSGVRRYQIMRPVDNPNFVLIDLEFDTAKQAEVLLAAMREMWGRIQGTIMSDPKARIVEAVEPPRSDHPLPGKRLGRSRMLGTLDQARYQRV
jgi:hypothetical protein